MRASSKGQVVLRIALWLKLVRMLKLVSITIARCVEENNLVVLLSLDK